MNRSMDGLNTKAHPTNTVLCVVITWIILLRFFYYQLLVKVTFTVCYIILVLYSVAF